MKSNQSKRAFLSFWLVLLFVATGYLQAQHIEAERDKIFEHIDLTQVPYGILEDYGLSPVSLLPYTKRQLDTTNYLNYVTLQQIMLSPYERLSLFTASNILMAFGLRQVYYSTWERLV